MGARDTTAYLRWGGKGEDYTSALERVDILLGAHIFKEVSEDCRNCNYNVFIIKWSNFCHP